jgi:nitroreductase
MEAIEAICSRRSIRRFTDQPVTDDVLTELIEAGMCAPSAGNERPWHFIIIRDRNIFDEIPRIHPYAMMLKEAPVAILVCGDLDIEKHKGFWVQDCAAATENILIAAHAKGLGAVWTGIYPMEDRVAQIQKLLGLPENVIPLSLIPIGHPVEEKPRPRRFDGSRVHYGKW